MCNSCENGSLKAGSDPGARKEGVTRRAFLKLLLATSFILSFLPFAPMMKFFFAKQKAPGSARKKIANKKDLPEGSTMVFFYPGEEDVDRTFLTHLSSEFLKKAEAEGRAEFIADGFVAFNTICTHLQCPIEFPEDETYTCPCHGGVFNIFDGSVLDGPPPRPLPAIRLEVDQTTGDIYAVELIGKIGYGRE